MKKISKIEIKVSQNYRFEKPFVFKIYNKSGLDTVKRDDEKTEQNFMTKERLNIDDYFQETFAAIFSFWYSKVQLSQRNAQVSQASLQQLSTSQCRT